MELVVKPCIKCGHDRNILEYVPTEYVEHRTFNGTELKVIEKLNDFIWATCCRCQYTWKAQPITKDTEDTK